MSSGNLLDARLPQQRRDFERCRLARREVLQQVLERESGVDDVLDEQHVHPIEIVIKVLQDPHDPGGLGRGAVGRDRHEVELERQPDVAGEVGHDHERALQDPHEQQRLALVVGGDLLAHLRELALDLLGGDQDAFDVGFIGLHVIGQCRDRGHRSPFGIEQPISSPGKAGKNEKRERTPSRGSLSSLREIPPPTWPTVRKIKDRIDRLLRPRSGPVAREHVVRREPDHPSGNGRRARRGASPHRYGSRSLGRRRPHRERP